MRCPKSQTFLEAPHNSAIFLLTGLTATHINASITDAQSATIHGIYWIASEDLPETIIIRITLITTFITNIPASFSYPEEITKMQNKAASQSMVADMGKYGQMAMADNIGKGGNNIRWRYDECADGYGYGTADDE